MESYTTKNKSLNMLWITLFSIAMGFLEAAVVVYLRAIYYPDGFQFPLVPISLDHLLTETGREAATLIMLVGIGIAAGRSKWEKFAVFLYTFAVWDVFYYVFLKWVLNWPESLLTWDILFLIPTTWTGPVLSPVISAFTMVLLSLVIIYYSCKHEKYAGKTEVWILITGSFVQIVSFVWDYVKYVSNEGALRYLFNYEKMNNVMLQYVPVNFPWIIFMAGEAILLFGIYKIYKKSLN